MTNKVNKTIFFEFLFEKIKKKNNKMFGGLVNYDDSENDEDNVSNHGEDGSDEGSVLELSRSPFSFGSPLSRTPGYSKEFEEEELSKAPPVEIIEINGVPALQSQDKEFDVSIRSFSCHFFLNTFL